MKPRDSTFLFSGIIYTEDYPGMQILMFIFNYLSQKLINRCLHENTIFIYMFILLL